MRRAILAFILLPLWTSANADDCDWIVAGVGAPVYANSADHEVEFLCRPTYYVSHNNHLKIPDWVAERLTERQVTGQVTRKIGGNPFRADPNLPKNKRAELEDYKNSGYDRGHMSPAADSKVDLEFYKTTFYLSNMAPQTGKNLNQHIWAWLEARVRDWACDAGELVVITGPLLADSEEIDVIGPNEVAVPIGFFKIAYDPSRKRAISFILPNEEIKIKQVNFDAEIARYIVSMREVEIQSGLKLFPKLQKRDRNRLLSLKSVMWGVHQGCGDAD